MTFDIKYRIYALITLKYFYFWFSVLCKNEVVQKYFIFVFNEQYIINALKIFWFMMKKFVSLV